MNSSATADRKPATSAPISTHPLFPVLVGLWFAALLGIGSLIVPASLLERMVAGLHLDAIIPAAAPPLGLTGRLLIALAGTVVGALGGVALARRIAGAVSPQGRKHQSTFSPLAALRRRSPSPTPILAYQELGEEGFDRVVDDEDAEPALQWAGTFNRDTVSESPVSESPVSEPDALVALSFAEDRPEAGEVMADGANDRSFDEDDEEGAAPAIATDDVSCAELQATDFGIIGQDAEIDARSDAMFEEGPAPDTVDDRRDEGPAEDPSAFEMPADDISTNVAPPRDGEISAPASRTRPAIAERPLDELGMVELVERLAYSMQENCARAGELAWVAAPLHSAAQTASRTDDADPVEAAVSIEQPEDVGSKPAIDSATDPAWEDAPADYSPASDAMPAVLRPIDLDLSFEEDEAEEDFGAFGLPKAGASPDATENDGTEPARPMGIHLDSAACHDDYYGAEEDEEGEDTPDSSYSSLLDMKRPANREPSQTLWLDEAEGDDEAAESADGDGGEASDAEHDSAGAASHETWGGATAKPEADPADGDETEQALRAALASLQRMSGAA